MKVAFLCWNPFQIIQFANIIKEFINNYKIIIIDKGSNLKEFDFKKLKKAKYDYIVISQKYVTSIDGVYDILFFQSPFPYIEDIKISKLVSIQYGLAKERHDYGEWRSLADMNLMYGMYSTDIVSHYAPSYAIGNPKFDNWREYQTKDIINTFKKSLKIPATKKVILYMPTWGELGSFEELCGNLSALQDDYYILLKMHHNNEHALKNWVDIAHQNKISNIFHGNYDQLKLLAIADIVISDFSGAIFDAMYANKPIILFQSQVENKISVQKFDLTSIEYRERAKIGYISHFAVDFDN